MRIGLVTDMCSTCTSTNQVENLTQPPVSEHGFPVADCTHVLQDSRFHPNVTGVLIFAWSDYQKDWVHNGVARRQDLGNIALGTKIYSMVSGTLMFPLVQLMTLYVADEITRARLCEKLSASLCSSSSVRMAVLSSSLVLFSCLLLLGSAFGATYLEGIQIPRSNLSFGATYFYILCLNSFVLLGVWNLI